MERGIEEIGFVEHAYQFVEAKHLLEPWVNEYASERTDDFVRLVLGLKAEGLPVKLGVETDFIRGREHTIETYLQAYPWDYIIGSVHWDFRADGAFPFDLPDVIWPEEQVEGIYSRYFDLVLEAASSGLFDTIGHIDVVKTAGQRPITSYAPLLEEVIRSIARNGICMELNSSGMRKPSGEMFPTDDALRFACQAGVPVTLGSDAHWSNDSGFMIKEALGKLASAGYTSVMRFSQRKPCSAPIRDIT